MPSPARELGLLVPGSVRIKRFARSLDGTRIYYEVGGRGDGSPLVLVRGLARSSAYWLTMRDRLEVHHRVVVLDNRGVGRSDSPWLPWTTRAMAEDVSAVIEQSGIGRAHVFGISLGGMIAQELAIEHPERVDALVLCSTSPGGRGAIRTPRAAALALARAASLPPEQGIRESAQWVLSAEFLRRQPEISDVWVAIAQSEPHSRRGVAWQLLAAARHDGWERLPRIRAKTLVVTGDADRLIPFRNSERIANNIAGATLRIVPGAGHDIPTERPEEMAELVRAHLG